MLGKAAARMTTGVRRAMCPPRAQLCGFAELHVKLGISNRDSALDPARFRLGQREGETPNLGALRAPPLCVDYAVPDGRRLTATDLRPLQRRGPTQIREATGEREQHDQRCAGEGHEQR